MIQEQILILFILFVTIVMFVWGRWRHDMVAMGALLACVLTGLTPSAQAFAGFGHPAVITVACVLILSRGLQDTGAVDALAKRVLPTNAGPTLTIAAVTALAAALSVFMNNVGALALMMPVAMQIASRQNLAPGRVLMPMAFGSILGGMTTLIGTPPNLIVSGFRAENGFGGFAMFDFTPVGLAIAAAGVAFTALLGWRLVPARQQGGNNKGFETSAYLTEARVPDKSKVAGMTLREIEAALDDVDAQVIGLIRDEARIPAPHPARKVRAGDILVIEAEPEALASALSNLGLKLEEDKRKEIKDAEKAEQVKGAEAEETIRNAIQTDEIVLMEFTVLPDSALVGRSATQLRLRTRYGINLLAVSRQGRRSLARLRTMSIRAGDVLLLQGAPDTLTEFAAGAGCVPLAERAVRIPDKRGAIIASTIMLVAVSGAAFGLLPAAIAFAAGALACVAMKVISPRIVYNAIDWPVVVLLGALIPVAVAIENTGAADLIAQIMLKSIAQGHAVIALTLILVITMMLSDFMNNAATAAVMCPIAIGAASKLEVNSDAFLMAVAVGASCAFLTPIGHQNNTLILGPGGFRFGDYWRLGMPLEIIVVAVGVPMILLVWPL